MKKMIFSISAMLFVGAVSFAQLGPGPAPAIANSSFVGQSGSYESANVNQIGWNQKSKVIQAGDHNTSQVAQGVNPNQIIGSFPYLPINLSFSNSADVSQNGQRNTAYISQNNWKNTAKQIQVGNDNEATIWQDETQVQIYLPLKLHGQDTANQTQMGNKNKATVDQGTSGNSLPSASIFTGMAALPAAPFSPHGYNVATQTQDGNYGIAYASQGGLRNVSNQTQHGTLAGVGTENVSNHYQYGEDNTSNSTQTGWKNMDNQLQQGNFNTSVVTQSTSLFGPGNGSVVLQQGNFNTSMVMQSN